MKKVIGIAATVAALGLAVCGSDDDASEADAAAADETTTTATETTDTTVAAETTETTENTEDTAGCGITLAEVEAQMPTATGVTENDTPDPGRCNFTWDDGGARGADVAIIPGGRADVAVPADFQALDGYGDEGYWSATDERASAIAFVGDDVYAVDVTADSGATDAELLSLAVTFLSLSLP